VKDLQTGATNLVSVNLTGTPGNGSSTLPQISFDGRYVVFASTASDLVPNDNNHLSDIFVRDRLLGTTLLVTLNRAGTASGDGASSQPVLGADGRTVVFQSSADDLVEGDFNGTRDVFVLRIRGGDSDHDGMDDDWEVAYFGDLSRDGSGDFDGDGHTDLQEFLAGTDPTNNKSILRVMKLTLLSGGGPTLLWSAVPGRTYRVQFKNALTDADWLELPDAVTAVSTTASLRDNSSSQGSQRYYRVVLSP
jgi:hypothetical protein